MANCKLLCRGLVLLTTFVAIGLFATYTLMDLADPGDQSVSLGGWAGFRFMLKGMDSQTNRDSRDEDVTQASQTKDASQTPPAPPTSTGPNARSTQPSDPSTDDNANEASKATTSNAPSSTTVNPTPVSDNKGSTGPTLLTTAGIHTTEKSSGNQDKTEGNEGKQDDTESQDDSETKDTQSQTEASTVAPSTTASIVNTNIISTQATQPNTATPDNNAKVNEGSEENEHKPAKNESSAEGKDGTGNEISTQETVTKTIPHSTTLDTRTPCQKKPYLLREHCNLSNSNTKAVGVNATIESLLDDVFVGHVLNRLTESCDMGEWCIGNYGAREMYQKPLSLGLCDIETCLWDMPDECETERRRMILGTIFLLCDLENQNASDTCWASTRKMTHVAMADVLGRYEDKTPRCSRKTLDANCTGSCGREAPNLHCLCCSCGHNTTLFNEYTPWLWFFGDKTGYADHCNINDTDCDEFVPDKRFGGVFSALGHMDPRVLTGLSCSLLVTLAGIATVVGICMRRISKDNKYTRDRVQYAEVKNYEDPETESE